MNRSIARANIAYLRSALQDAMISAVDRERFERQLGIEIERLKSGTDGAA